MKSRLVFAIVSILFTVSLLSGCGSDDADAPKYSIKVTNTTAVAVEIFLSADNGSFTSKGIIPTGEFREYSDMLFDVNYKLRGSVEGDSADEFITEHSVSNSNPDIISLNFDISM